METSHLQKSQEVEPRPDTVDVLMADEPVATEAQAMPTISDLLAEAGPIPEQPKMTPTMFEPEQPTAVPSASEMTSPSMEMDKGDSQYLLPMRPLNQRYL